MKKAIWKFPFDASKVLVNEPLLFEVEMPACAQVLHVDVQTQLKSAHFMDGSALAEEIPCIWALVTTDNTVEKRQFMLAGTGHPIPEIAGLAHIGTFKMAQDRLVYHLFEKR